MAAEMGQGPGGGNLLQAVVTALVSAKMVVGKALGTVEPNHEHLTSRWPGAWLLPI